MSSFRFYQPIVIRYADLDPWGHVNNARFLSLFEQARLSYLIRLGLWDGVSYHKLGFIVADTHVVYIKPILPLQTIRIGVRVAAVGNKSVRFEQQIENMEDGSVMARAEVVAVAYNYQQGRSHRVSDPVREIFAQFESGQ